MGRIVESPSLHDIDVRPSKRVRLSHDDADSAYASLSSPEQEHKAQEFEELAVQATDVELETQSAISSTPKRPKSFFCTFDGCDKAFDRPARLEIHIRSHTHERPFVCSEVGCDKTFVRAEHLKAHVTSKHSDVRNYTCDYSIGQGEDGEPLLCGKSFHTGTRLRRHIAAHEDKEQTKCQDCGQIFRKQETLQRHIRSAHLGENAFRCTFSDAVSEQCGQTFPTVAQLKAHESREHSGSRYFCNMCPEDQSGAPGFSTYADLQTHLKLIHPPACNLCGETCSSTRALKAHMDIVHSALTDRQRFECEHPGCDRKFTKKGNLSVHVRTVHASERNFVCGQFDLSQSPRVSGWSGLGCGSGFGTKAGLEGHVRTQHLNLPLSHKTDVSHQHGGDAVPTSTSIVNITGHGYDQIRPIECVEQSCPTRFRFEHELVVHLELHHGWNIDDINDCLAELSAQASDNFWIGGDDVHNELLSQYLVDSLSNPGRFDLSAKQKAHEPSEVSTVRAYALDPVLR